MADKDWSYGDWDGRAALYHPAQSHACIDGKTWTPCSSAEVSSSRRMTKDAFEEAFPDLPPYPALPGSTPAQTGAARADAAA